MAESRRAPAVTNSSAATLSLLRRAHPTAQAASIHADKFHQRTLALQPSTRTRTASETPDARARRRAQRDAKLVAQGRRRPRRPQPLSATEKRRLCVYDMPREERKHSIYLGLHELWCAYMRDILLDWPQQEEQQQQDAIAPPRKRQMHVDPQQAGAKVASADFHGAEVTVVRSRCVSRVGVRGIVVRDTLFTFELVTRDNEIKTIPKEHTVFRVEIPLVRPTAAAAAADQPVDASDPPKNLVFEIHGEQFQTRAPDRAIKKFKLHISKDL